LRITLSPAFHSGWVEVSTVPDAGDHGKAAHHRRLAGDGKTVLVIERRPLGADRDVAIHEIALVEIGEAGL